MFRTIRSRNRRIVPAVLGSVAIFAAVYLMQAASGSTESAEPQLAVALSDESPATRGVDRNGDADLASLIATASEDGSFGSPADAPDATTTTVAPVTTVPPTTSTTAKPAPKPVTPPAPPKPKPVAAAPVAKADTTPVADSGAKSICAISPGNWCTLAKCESGDRDVNTGNGFYGFFQFDKQTWKAYGGTTPTAYGAPASEQLRVAQNLYNNRKWQPWPSCGANLK